MTEPKPSWWPECPWPDDVFIGDIKELPILIPDDNLRTKVCGIMSRFGWNNASDAIWEAMQKNTQREIAEAKAYFSERDKRNLT